MFRQAFNWNELERLRQDVDRLFESSLPRVYRPRSRTFPAINVWTNEVEGVIVTAELPGVSADSIDISVTGDTLEISGTRQPMEEATKEKYHRQERSYGDFKRSVQLPYAVNTEAVQATAEKGVLRITLPRAEAEKPKQIAVRAG